MLELSLVVDRMVEFWCGQTAVLVICGPPKNY